MSKPRTPTPPDPQQTAAAQTGTNVSTAIANTAMGQVNQVTPDGSLTYSNTGEHTWQDPATGQTYTVPRYTATTTLSPGAQAIRDQNNRADLTLATLGADQAGRATDLLSRPMDLSGAPAASDRSGWTPSNFSDAPFALPGTAQLRTGYGPEDGFSADRQRVEDALMDRLQGQRDRDYEGLRTQLTNQGINIGTEAYSRALEDFDRNQNEMRVSAMLGAGQEQSRLSGLARDEATFANNSSQQDFTNRMGLFGMGEDIRRYGDSMEATRFGQQGAIYDAQDNARSRSLTETMALRNQPINEIIALLSGSQVQTPQFGVAQPSSIPTTDVAGINQQGFANSMARYQAQMAPWQQAMGGLFGLGQAAILGG